MHEPEFYENNNNGVGNAAAAALRKMGNRIKWRPDRKDTILDLGCGTGNVLIEVILPAFDGKYSMCYGVDISNTMIEFATEKYANREDVRFLTMDMNKVDIFGEKFGPVDHVISSFALHWLTDLDAGLRSVYDLLIPGGDFFTDHVCSSFLYDLYETIGNHKRWGRYFKDIRRFVQPSHKSTQPAEDLTKQLLRAGFVDVEVQIMGLNWLFANEDCVRKLLSSVVVQIGNIPENEREEYLDYVLEFGKQQKGLTQLPNGEYIHHIEVFVAFGRKL